MTRTGATKRVPDGYDSERLRLARAFLKAAESLAALADDGDAGNPIVSEVVNAAIAYTDALTAKFANRVNQEDHAAAAKVLRGALGERLPNDQERRLRRILGEKDAAQYGARLKRKADVMRFLADIREFAKWAETEIDRRG